MFPERALGMENSRAIVSISSQRDAYFPSPRPHHFRLLGIGNVFEGKTCVVEKSYVDVAIKISRGIKVGRIKSYSSVASSPECFESYRGSWCTSLKSNRIVFLSVTILEILQISKAFKTSGQVMEEARDKVQRREKEAEQSKSTSKAN